MNIKTLAAVLECANSVRRSSMFDPFWDIKRHILTRLGKADGEVFQLFPWNIVKHRSYTLAGRQFLIPVTSIDLRIENIPDGSRCFKGLVKKPVKVNWVECESALELMFAPWLFFTKTDSCIKAVRIAQAVGPIPSVYLMNRPARKDPVDASEVPF